MSIRSILSVSLATAMVAACGGDPCGSLTEPLLVASVQLVPARLDLRVGQSRQLDAAPLTRCNQPVANVSVSWESSDPAVVTVSSSGMVSGVKPGNATVRAFAEGKTGVASINISVVPIAEVDIAPDNARVALGYDVVLTVQVMDSAGNILSGHAVTWTSSDPAVASVDMTGRVTGVAVGGPVTINALAGNVVGTTLVTVFRPSANGLSFSVEPSDVAAGNAIAPAVEITVLDSIGNRIRGDTTTVTLTLGANPSGGTLGGTAVVAAVDGVARFSELTLDQASAGYTLVASAQGVTPASSAPFTVSPGVAVGFTFVVQPASTQAGALIAPAVEVGVVDAFGNAVTASNDAIDIGIGTNPSGGTLSGTTTVAALQGVAAFSDLRIDKAGAGYTLEASSAGRTPATSNPFDITAASPTTLAFSVEPSDVLAGDSITPPVEVTVVDSLGNRIPGDTSTVTISLGVNPGGSALGGTLVVSAVDGVATFPDLTLDQAGAGYTLIASASGITPSSSAPFAVSPGVAVGFAFTVQPASTKSGALIAPAVEVSIVDAFGNTVTTSSDAIDIGIGTNPSGGTLSGTTTVAAVQGVAVFSDLSIDKAGAGYTLEASSAGRIPATSTPFDITAAFPTALAFTVQPSDVSAGDSIAPLVEVTVLDSLGNRIPGDTSTVWISLGVNPGGSALGGTLVVSAVNGVATFPDLTLDQAGSGYTIVASASGIPPASSAPFAVSPGSAVGFAFTVQPASTQAGALIAPAVEVSVVDAFSNTVTTSNEAIDMSIGTNPSGGTLSGTTTVVAVQGVAVFSDLSIDRAGKGYALEAGSAGRTPATSNPFDITPGPAVALVFLQQPTTEDHDKPIRPPIEVGVVDGWGNLVDTATTSIAMSIAVNPGGSVLNGTTTQAAVNGVAVFDDLSLSKKGTDYVLAADAPGLAGALSVLFRIK